MLAGTTSISTTPNSLRAERSSKSYNQRSQSGRRVGRVADDGAVEAGRAGIILAGKGRVGRLLLEPGPFRDAIELDRLFDRLQGLPAGDHELHLKMNPPSTGIIVSGNLSSIGGVNGQAFLDDGTNGDAVAGKKHVVAEQVAVDRTPGQLALAESRLEPDFVRQKLVLFGSDERPHRTCRLSPPRRAAPPGSRTSTCARCPGPMPRWP